MSKNFIIYTDGGARGNPGPAGAGAVIQDKNGAVIKEISKFLGTQTNNWAEYEAVYLVLHELKKLVPERERRHTHIEVRMDSELIQKQLSNEYQVKETSLVPQFIKIHNIQVKDFPNMTFVHIRREQNKEADRLANEAMD